MCSRRLPMVKQDGQRGALQQAINTSIRARIRGDENRIKSPCLGVGWAKNKQSLLGYAFGNTRNFLQIYLAMPSLLPKVKRFFFLAAWSRVTRQLFTTAVLGNFISSFALTIWSTCGKFSTLQLCVYGAVETERWHGFARTHQHTLSACDIGTT